MAKRLPGRGFVCGVCYKPFKFMSEIRRHCEAEHLDLSYPCPICNLSLRTEKYRQRHVREKHGISLKASEIRDMEMGIS